MPTPEPCLPYTSAGDDDITAQVKGDRLAGADALGLGIISTVDLRTCSTSGQTMPAVNTTSYARVVAGGVITKIGLEVTNSNGNICVAVYSNSGEGRDAVPATRKATSGSVACPSIGYAEVSLGGSVVVEPGDWIALSSSGTTAAFRAAALNNIAGGVYKGWFANEAAFPAPATATPTQGIARSFVLVGVV